MAIRLGNESKLQEDINTENYLAIALYLQKFSEFQFTGGQNEEFRLELGKDCARVRVTDRGDVSVPAMMLNANETLVVVRTDWTGLYRSETLFERLVTRRTWTFCH